MKINKQTSLILSAVAAAALPAAAQVDYTGAPGGDWNTPGNWSGGAVPGAGDLAGIGNAPGSPSGSIVNISGALTQDTIFDLRVGSNGNDGTVNQSAGSLTTTNWSFIGVDAGGGTGTYNLSGGSLTTTDANFYVGFNGGPTVTGNLNVSGTGSLTSEAMHVGDGNAGAGSGATGNVNQTGGSVNVNQWLVVGRSNDGVGTYDMSAGTLGITNDYLTLGEASGGNGTFNVSGTAAITANGGGIIVGRGDTGVGAFNVTGSSATINARDLVVGAQFDYGVTTATGTLNFVADAGGVTAISLSELLFLGAGNANLTVDLSAFAGSGEVVLIETGFGTANEFVGLPEGAAVPGSGGRFITYLGGDGNDVSLIVPEPSSALLALLGGLALMRRRR